MIGTSRETLTKVLNELRDAGLVDVRERLARVRVELLPANELVRVRLGGEGVGGAAGLAVGAVHGDADDRASLRDAAHGLTPLLDPVVLEVDGRFWGCRTAT